MEIALPVFSGIALTMVAASPVEGGYPTARLQKGLLLAHDGQELVEEGVGFGVPVLKRGIETIFPGHVELTSRCTDSIQEVTCIFKLYLKERIARPGLESVQSHLVYTTKNLLAAVIRRFPPLRGLLTAASNALRRTFGLRTTFEETSFRTYVKLMYAVDSQTGTIKVQVDTTNLAADGITEVVVMNEQGAHFFDRYRDSDGTVLRGKEIGCWDKVAAASASFISETHRLAYTVRQVDGATLYRGRELIASRLAWSGFGYSFPPAIGRINYEIRIERLP